MKPILKLVASILLLLSVAYIDNVKCPGCFGGSNKPKKISPKLTSLVACLNKICHKPNNVQHFDDLSRA